MAKKPGTEKFQLKSTAGTGSVYYVTKNARQNPSPMVLRKYDPKIRQHVEFKQSKMPRSSK